MELIGKIILPQIGLFLIFYLQLSSSDEVLHYRVEDKPFPSPLVIHSRKVHCSQDDHSPGMFPAFTWTCKDMRVDGMRMAYGYNPSITKDNKCQETNGRDELAEVCRRMMHAFGASYTLWAAFVTNATCNFINEKRVFLNLTGPNMYEWEVMKPGYGWIDTLRCTAVQ